MRFDSYLKTLDVKYNFIKKFAKPCNKICGLTIDDLTFLPYKILKKEVPNLFEEGKFDEAIHLILKHYKKNITFIRVKLEKNNIKLLFILWIKKQYELINETESKYLFIGAFTLEGVLDKSIFCSTLPQAVEFDSFLSL